MFNPCLSFYKDQVEKGQSTNTKEWSVGRKSRLTDLFEFPYQLNGVWRETHYFYSPCHGDVMEKVAKKQIYAMDVEFCSTSTEDGKVAQSAIFVFIGFLASRVSEKIGKKQFPVYFATLNHPDMIDSLTVYHGITMHDAHEFGLHPSIVKKEVLSVLSKYNN